MAAAADWEIRHERCYGSTGDSRARRRALGEQGLAIEGAKTAIASSLIIPLDLICCRLRSRLIDDLPDFFVSYGIRINAACPQVRLRGCGPVDLLRGRYVCDKLNLRGGAARVGRPASLGRWVVPDGPHASHFRFAYLLPLFPRQRSPSTGANTKALLPIKASKHDLPFTERKCRAPRLVLNEAFEML